MRPTTSIHSSWAPAFRPDPEPFGAGAHQPRAFQRSFVAASCFLTPRSRAGWPARAMEGRAKTERGVTASGLASGSTHHWGCRLGELSSHMRSARQSFLPAPCNSHPMTLPPIMDRVTSYRAQERPCNAAVAWPPAQHAKQAGPCRSRQPTPSCRCWFWCLCPPIVWVIKWGSRRAAQKASFSAVSLEGRKSSRRGARGMPRPPLTCTPRPPAHALPPFLPLPLPEAEERQEPQQRQEPQPSCLLAAMPAWLVAAVVFGVWPLAHSVAVVMHSHAAPQLLACAAHGVCQPEC